MFISFIMLDPSCIVMTVDPTFAPAGQTLLAPSAKHREGSGRVLVSLLALLVVIWPVEHASLSKGGGQRRKQAISEVSVREK